MANKDVLVVPPLPEAAIAQLREAFRIHLCPPTGERVDLLGEHGNAIGAIATTARGRVDEPLLAALPNLRVIACFSAGTDAIDIAAAQRRGITISTTSRLIAGEVADLAMGLVIAVARNVCGGDRFVRDGSWRHRQLPLARSLTGKVAGIVGMGNIGRACAIRAAAFGMQVAYTGPRPKPDLDFLYVADLRELAAQSDFLIVCCPATEETVGMVDGRVLAALGPDGYLVNVARGNIVDEPALVAAIAARTIAGAGLDVFADEPNVPAPLLASPDVVVLPHIGAATVEIREAMARHVVAAIGEALGRAPDSP